MSKSSQLARRKSRREKHTEEMLLSAKNAYGNNDPTPFEALRHIVQQERENVE